MSKAKKIPTWYMKIFFSLSICLKYTLNALNIFFIYVFQLGKYCCTMNSELN